MPMGTARVGSGRVLMILALKELATKRLLKRLVLKISRYQNPSIPEI
jgi:hypothetical protein